MKKGGRSTGNEAVAVDDEDASGTDDVDVGDGRRRSLLNIICVTQILGRKLGTEDRGIGSGW